MSDHEYRTMAWGPMHVGRGFTGTWVEDDCPCEKAPCGLVARYAVGCAEHDPTFARTLRQAHPAAECPGVPL